MGGWQPPETPKMAENEIALALEDGFILRGKSFGAEGEHFGEVVFNTSMTGYQEILSDPSYKEQIITMTYPHIGNYGINPQDFESAGLHLEGLVVREYCPYPSNWRSKMSLGDLLKERGVPGISGVDTRALTRHIREAGAMRGVISTLGRSDRELVEMVQDYPGLVGRNIVRDVSTAEAYDWNEPMDTTYWKGEKLDESYARGLKIVVYDLGVKHNILRILASMGATVRVVPWNTRAEDVLAESPDGLLISNGPGDPAGVVETVREVRRLLGKLPVFGICMGHQILSQSLGGKTYKLKFGHRGANHPVLDLRTNTVGITSQNHGFAVDQSSFPDEADPQEPVRRHSRGDRAPGLPGVLRAVPPGSLARSPRVTIPVQTIHRADPRGGPPCLKGMTYTRS